MKKIAFHCNQLCLRGTEVSTFNYAKYNEEILGNKSTIMSFPGVNMDALPKFQQRFDVQIKNWWEYEQYLKENHFDYLFMEKMGIRDGYCIDSIPTLVQAVFRYNEPHGHRYFYISDWLAKDQGYTEEKNAVPYICEPLPLSKYNLRERLGISNTATIFGCYGGSTEFNIEFVKEAIIETVNKRTDIIFLFMNINKFTTHPQVIFLPGQYDMNEKAAFVNACDIMIHARSGGETFGLAVSEFALANKPVITYNLSGERCHIEILGKRGIYYNSKEEILDIFNNRAKYINFDDYDTPYRQFNPSDIMDRFNRVLLN